MPVGKLAGCGEVTPPSAPMALAPLFPPGFPRSQAALVGRGALTLRAYAQPSLLRRGFQISQLLLLENDSV